MTALIGRTGSPDLHVMTVNVRRRMGGIFVRDADRWEHRRDALAELLRTEEPTVIGIQEALPAQAEFIAGVLGERYRRIGYGRRPGPRGEGCPVFYDHHRLELRRAEQTALSEHPHVPGSRSWGALWPRVMVRATFRDRHAGGDLLLINTHLDPFSPRARVRSAALIRQAVADQELPAVVMGDLNADPSSRTVAELTRTEPTGRELRDSWPAAASQLTPEWRTYAGYRAPRSALGGRGRIDGIFVSSGIRVERAAISTRCPGGIWPSDHLPVHAVLHLPSSEGV